MHLLLKLFKNIKEEYNADCKEKNVRVNEHIYLPEVFLIFQFADGFDDKNCSSAHYGREKEHT